MIMMMMSESESKTSEHDSMMIESGPTAQRHCRRSESSLCNGQSPSSSDRRTVQVEFKFKLTVTQAGTDAAAAGGRRPGVSAVKFHFET
jgi:hypothetical protein